MKKKHIIVLTIIICVGVILVGHNIYSNYYRIDQSYACGSGTIDDPFILKNNGNKTKQECDQMILQYLSSSNLQTIELHPTRDDSDDALTGTRGFDYGTYKIQSLNDSSNINITDIIFVSDIVAQRLFLYLIYEDKLPKCLTNIEYGNSLKEKLISEEFNDADIYSYLRNLGDHWNSTLGKKEKKTINDSLVNGHSLITMTYVVKYENNWFSSSIILEWNEFVCRQKNQIYSLPAEVLQTGTISIPFEVI